jgi:hypothetical protein
MGCSSNVNFGRERITGCGCQYFIVGEGGRPGSERRGSRVGKRRVRMTARAGPYRNLRKYCTARRSSPLFQKALSRASSEHSASLPQPLAFVNQHCWSCPGSILRTHLTGSPAPSTLGSLDLQASRAARSEQTGTQNRTEKPRTGTAHGHNRPQTRSSSPGSLQLPTTVQDSNRTSKARQAGNKPHHPVSDGGLLFLTVHHPSTMAQQT